MVRRGTVLLLLALSIGCHRGGNAPSDVAPTPQLGELTIKVVNHGRLDVVIYVVHGGTRERIGESTASATVSFTFGMRHLGAGREYSLLGEPIGGRTAARTETLVADNGQLVIWTLEDDLRRSSVDVRSSQF